MNKPDYIAPYTLKDALEIMKTRGGDTRIIAGGTDLIPRMRTSLVEPSLLVDLRLLSLNYIELKSDLICIGSYTTHTDILESELLSIHIPAIVEAAKEIAGPPVRNRGTIGGNLVNASPAADLAPPLLVYDASGVLIADGKERIIPLEELFTNPGKTVLKPDEVLLEIRVPVVSPRTAAKFIKLGKRKAMAISVVSVAARLTLEKDGTIMQARIALGSVAPTPIRAKKAEAILEGNFPSNELFAGAAQTASAECSPISDIRASGNYRKKMVSVLTRRALLATWDLLNERSQNS